MPLLWLLAACGRGAPNGDEPTNQFEASDWGPILRGRTLVGTVYQPPTTNVPSGWGQLHLFDTESGAYLGLPASTALPGGFPAIGDDGMVLLGERMDLSAYTSSGLRWWHVPLGADASTSVSLDADERIYVGHPGALRVFDRDGNEVWGAGLHGATPRNRIALGADGSAAVFAGIGDRVDGVADWGLWVFGPDGETYVELATTAPIASPARTADGLVVAAMYDGDAADLGYAPYIDPALLMLRAFDGATGDVAWETALGEGAWSPLVTPDGDVIVAVYNAHVVVGRDGSDGRERWRSDDLGLLGEPALGDDGRIYVGCDQGICILDRRGHLEGSLSTFDLEVWGAPAIQDGWLYANVLGQLYRWDLRADVELAQGWARNGADNAGRGRVSP